MFRHIPEACGYSYFGSVITKSALRNCQSGSSYTRNLVGTSTVTGLSSSGPTEPTLAENEHRGGSSALALVVRRFTSRTRSPRSASEWLTTANRISNFPGPFSPTRKPTSSMYLAAGFLPAVALETGDGAPGFLSSCFGAVEQAVSSAQRLTVTIP